MQKITLITILFLTTLLHSKLIDYNIKPKNFNQNKYMGITILDSKELKFKKYKGFKFSEISSLAFGNKRLYATNDRGHLYTFKLKIKNNKIKKLKLRNVVKLKDENKNKLSRLDRDSEGMVFINNRLLISFEKNPRVEDYSLEGVRITKQKINKKLRKIKKYQAPNRALEALAYNTKYGIVTAPEVPFKNISYHILYAKKKTWKFRSQGNITALEFITDDEILVLQRSFNHFTRSRESVLSRVYLDGCKKKDICRSEVLFRMKSSDGWKIDNFEGLTRLDKKRFLMISDDNQSLFQKTLLVLFEVNGV